MGKIIKTGLLSVTLLATAVINATEKIKVTLKSEFKEVCISIKDLSFGEKIKILDRNSEEIHSEVVKKTNEYTRDFNFSKFSQGVHYIETISDSEIKITPFIINLKQKEIIKGETKIYGIPSFNFENGIATVNIDNSSKLPVTISVSGSGRELDVINNYTSELIKKTYSFSSMPSGDYYILVTIEDRYFSYKVELM